MPCDAKTDFSFYPLTAMINSDYLQQLFIAVHRYLLFACISNCSIRVCRLDASFLKEQILVNIKKYILLKNIRENFCEY